MMLYKGLFNRNNNIGTFSAPSYQLPKHPDGFPIMSIVVFFAQRHGTGGSMGKYRTYVA